jgi:hypothetical protein
MVSGKVAVRHWIDRRGIGFPTSFEDGRLLAGDLFQTHRVWRTQSKTFCPEKTADRFDYFPLRAGSFSAMPSR